MVAHGWAAPAPVDPERATGPEPLTRLVEGLAVLPGAEYVLALDVDGERVRGESGGAPGPALAVLGWARRVADVCHERCHDLEDLVLTTETAFHLVRLVAPERDAGEPVWVTVRIDRTRGNLAWARRALAGLGAPVAVPGPRAVTSGPESPAPLRPATSSRPSEPFTSSRPATSGTSPSMPTLAERFSAKPADPSPGGSAPVVLSPVGSSPAGPAPAGPAPAGPSSLVPVKRSSVARSSTAGEPAPGRSWFTPSSASSPQPEESPEASSSSTGAARLTSRGPLRASAASPSSWFATSPDSGRPPSRGAAATDGPAAGPATGGFPAAMPAPVGRSDEWPRELPSPRRDAEAGTPSQGDRGALDDSGLPRRPRGSTVRGARRVGSPPTGTDTAADEPSSPRLPLTERQAVWWSGRSERPDTPELGPPTGPNPVVSGTVASAEAVVPAARTSAEDAPAPAVPAPREAGLFAPVVVVPPPPSPVPEDDTAEMPAPMPAPVVTLESAAAPQDGSADTADPPETPSDETPSDETPSDEAEPDEAESDDAGSDEAGLPDLPLRHPGAHMPSGLSATPRNVPAVHPAAAVAGTAAFNNEPSVLRRLIDGLRRLS